MKYYHNHQIKTSDDGVSRLVTKVCECDPAAVFPVPHPLFDAKQAAEAATAEAQQAWLDSEATRLGDTAPPEFVKAHTAFLDALTAPTQDAPAPVQQQQAVNLSKVGA